MSTAKCLSTFDSVTSKKAYIYSNVAIRTSNFVLFVRLSQAYVLNTGIVGPEIVSVSLLCLCYDMIIFSIV
jgi:hypothetical protein